MKTEARYREVRRALAEEIHAGRYEIGGKFPTDLELCKRFECSRHTIREALRELQAHGLLERRRGAGTVVSRYGAEAAFSMKSSSLDDILNNATESIFEVQHFGKLSVRAPLAKVIGCEVGETWLRIAGVRRDKVRNIKLAWAEVFVPEEYFGVREFLKVPQTSIFNLLEKEFGVSVRVLEQEINAVSIAPMNASELDLEPNSPGLSVLRRYYDADGKLFQSAVSLYGAGHFSIKSQLFRTDPLTDHGAIEKNDFFEAKKG